MAEALYRAIAPDGVEVLSAGVEPWGDLHPMARLLMAERGLDLTGHHPKHVRQFEDADLEAVITIGDRAKSESPDFRTGVRRVHWPIDDPAGADGTPDSESVFRETCVQIERRLAALTVLLESLPARRAFVCAPAVSTCIVRPNRFCPREDIPMIAETGFRHIELCCYREQDFPWEDRSEVAALKAIAADCGVSVVSVHPPDRGNVASSDRRDRIAQEDVLLRMRDLAVELGAGTLAAHFGYGLPEADARPTALAVQRDALGRLAEDMASSPVILCLETLPARAADMPNTDVIDLARELPAAGIGVVLDTGHCNIASDLPGLASRAGRRLQALHLNDNDGRGDQHRMPGDGTVDWPSFMTELIQSGYEGPLMLEVHARETEDLPQALKHARAAVDGLKQVQG